jgi:hypothetical protein
MTLSVTCSKEVSRTFGKAYERKTGTHLLTCTGIALQIARFTSIIMSIKE